LRISSVASEGVLRVNVDNLKSAEGRQNFAVVHVSEDRNQLVVIVWEREGADRSNFFVGALFLLKRFVDPSASVVVDTISNHLDLLAVLLVVGFGSVTGEIVGIIPRSLIHSLAFFKRHVKVLEASTSFTS